MAWKKINIVSRVIEMYGYDEISKGLSSSSYCLCKAGKFSLKFKMEILSVFHS